MKLTLFIRLAFICLIGAMLGSCTSKPKISDVFKEQVTRMLEEGATLTSMTKQGVNYSAYSQQLAKVKGAYDLASATWPSDFASEAKPNFEKAFEGWDLTLSLWALKIGDKDNPVEPNINGYTSYTNYVGDSLIIETYPSDFIVKSYRGKKYLPFDDNISVLLSKASNYFEEGRKLLLAEMP
jgi:hypothetical protein